jgi:hypothetical protein
MEHVMTPRLTILLTLALLLAGGAALAQSAGGGASGGSTGGASGTGSATTGTAVPGGATTPSTTTTAPGVAGTTGPTNPNPPGQVTGNPAAPNPGQASPLPPQIQPQGTPRSDAAGGRGVADPTSTASRSPSRAGCVDASTSGRATADTSTGTPRIANDPTLGAGSTVRGTGEARATNC